MNANFVEVDHLPFGQSAVWYADLNTVAVLRTLTPCERERALDDLQIQWRRTLAIPAQTAAPAAVA